MLEARYAKKDHWIKLLGSEMTLNDLLLNTAVGAEVCLNLTLEYNN